MITKIKYIKYLVFILLLDPGKVLCEGKESLTFVIDDTSSMSDDIKQVKSGVNAIFDTVLNFKDSQIGDFVLVTFNDPATELRIITKDRTAFKDALSLIEVYGGDDCPEYAISGIIKGIANSKPGSTIYVYTDAAAKDYTLYEEAKNIAIRRQIQVVFVLTGLCDTKSSSNYKVYESLADNTMGQVFHLGKHDISEILNYVIENLKGKRTELLNKKLPPGKNSVNFTIDGDTKDPTVSVTGDDKPKVTTIGPDGSEVKTKSLVDKHHISITKILDPKPGVHTVEISSANDTHLVVTARTDIKFQHGFSIYKPSSIEDTTTTPLPGVKSHITIQLTSGFIELKTVKVIGMDITLIKEIPLVAINELEKLYTTELDEDLPNNMFKIAITGYDPVSKTTLTRVGSPVATQPNPVSVAQKEPDVLIMGPSTLDVEWNKPLQLKCKVKGYPQPNIVWMDKDSGDVLPGKVSAIELPYDFISILDINNVQKSTNYQCSADNVMGSDSTNVQVVITTMPYFTILKKPKDTTLHYGKNGEISCQVDAYPPVTIKWRKDGNILLKTDNLEFTDDNSVLKIKEMHTSDDGTYACEVDNAHNTKLLSAKVTITGVQAPVIESTRDTMAISSGTDAVINCKVIQGFPKPTISWFFSNETSGEEVLLAEWNDMETITIHNANESSSGIYTCIAKNEIRSDSHELALTIEYPATITGDAEDIVVAAGESIVIPCNVKGEPEPVVTWYKDNVLITKVKIFMKNHSIKMTADVKDSGTYTCKATNKFGTVSRDVKLEVNIPATIALPKLSKMNAVVGTSLNLPCQTKGYPTPDTKWTYHNFDPTVPPKTILKSVGSVAMKLDTVQLQDEGYYTCSASNSGGHTNITYEIHAHMAPKVENIYMNKVFKAVEGDLVVMIKCKASGVPPPIIRWLKNGFWVATGDDFTIENGTIIIKKISKDDEGVYVCEAKNYLGYDRDVYQVSVEKSPQSGLPTSTIIMPEGNSSAVDCDVPHRRTDLLRWYKSGMLIHSGELSITNAQASDSGLYTCRVSNFINSTSGNTLVKVGLKPKFARDEEENIEYVEGTPYVLVCDTTGTAKPEMTWWHNGAIMNTTESYYYFEMEVGTEGQYVCEAKNEFGSITRSFNVTSKGCLIDIKDMTSNLQPLIVSSRATWLHDIVKNGFLSISKDDYIVFICPNSFDTIKTPLAIGYCEGGTKFKISGKSYEYSNIKCTEKVTHSVESTGRSCFAGTTEMLKVVFQIKSRNIEAYDICFDVDNDVPLYTTIRLHNSIADIDHFKAKWMDNAVIDFNFDEAFKCSQQSNIISLNLGRRFHRDDGCCFEKRMLVNPKDLFPGVPQRAAYNYLNVVPHWSTCNAASNNWNEVEHRVRTLAKKSYSDLVVSTGVAEHLTLPDFSGLPKRIFIEDGSRRQHVVPRYLWKVVQSEDTRSSLVIIQVNVPDLLPAEVAKYVHCRDICNTTKWMKGSTWHDVHRGYTYCCQLKDFEAGFGYSRVFAPSYNILNDVSSIPDVYSLT